MFTSSYKSDGETSWTPIYRLVDEAGAYGDTVYVGLASTAVDNATGRAPYFDWRFSNVRVGPIRGISITFRYYRSRA